MSVHYFNNAILVLAPLSEEQLQMRNCALLTCFSAHLKILSKFD